MTKRPARKTVPDTLRANRCKLDTLAEALLARETLDEDEVYILIGNGTDPQTVPSASSALVLNTEECTT